MRTRRHKGVEEEAGDVIEINDSTNVDILQRLPRRRQQTVRFIESLGVYSNPGEDPTSSADETASPLYQLSPGSERAGDPPSGDEDDNEEEEEDDDDGETAEDESEDPPSPDGKQKSSESASRGSSFSKRIVRSAAEPTPDEIKYSTRLRLRSSLEPELAQASSPNTAKTAEASVRRKSSRRRRSGIGGDVDSPTRDAPLGDSADAASTSSSRYPIRQRNADGQGNTVSALETLPLPQSLSHHSSRYTLRDRSRQHRDSFDDSAKNPSDSSSALQSSRSAVQVADRATRYAMRAKRDGATSSPEKASHHGGFHRSTKSYSLRDRSNLRRQGTSSNAAPGPNYPLYDDFGDARPPKRSKHHVDRQQSSSTAHKLYALSTASSSGSSSDGEMQMIKRSRKRRKHGRRSSQGSSAFEKEKAAPPADISPLDIDPSITWDSIGGLKSHIHALQEMVLLPLLYPEFYAKFALTPPSGVLFYGPPGTGKTLVARALANSTGNQRITFYMRKGADCLSKWVGEAERQLRVLFEQAKKTEPSIIFFDEIDGLAPVRSAKQDQIHASIVSTLLALMDGLDSRGRVIVIGATNRIDAIDPALRRPGRFDRELAFTLPNATDRAAMLGIHTKQWQPPLSASFKTQLAKELVGYCGADIKALCAETALVAFKRSFPQVYDTPAKLDVDLTTMHVMRSDFQLAQAKIVPAAARSQTAVAAPLPPILAPLLEEPLAKLVDIVQAAFPTGLFAPPPTLAANAAPIYDLAATSCSNCLSPLPSHGDNESENAVETCESCHQSFHARCLATSTRCFACLPSYTYIPPSLVRCLVFGSSGAMGQSVLTSALLSHMDGFPCVEFDRFSSPSQWMTKWSEVLTRVPCVVYFPHLDQSWTDHPTEIPALLHHWLQAAHHLPIVAVATASTTALPADLVSLFPHQFQVTPPGTAARRSFWSVLATWASSPPPVAPPPPKALRVMAPPSTAATKNKPAASVLNDQEQHHLRELRIFLEAVVSYCIREKANAPFVVIETALDDGSTVRRHMDLATIRDNVHDGEYTTWEKFMAHVHEIVRDACAAYPKNSSLRYIAHAAANMQDNVMSFAHRFRKEQGYDLFATCREIQQAKLAARPVPAPMRLRRPGALPPPISPPPPAAVEVIDLDASCDDVVEVFVVGDHVFVEKRTGPGMNKLGGAGLVQHVHETAEAGLKYDVKYILGGFEKEIDAKHVQRLTEDTVQASVKMHATTTVVGARRATAPTADDIFDATVWPHLYQVGWEYVPPPVGLWVVNPPSDTPDALPKSKEEWIAAHQCFDSRDDVLAFVKKSPDYARLCFGHRYVEMNIADGLAPKPVPRTPQEEMYYMMLEDKPAAQDTNGDAIAVARPPAFDVDEDQVRSIVEDVVTATEGWSVDALRQELVKFNHIVLAHRQDYDRRAMVEALRAHVQTLH